MVHPLQMAPKQTDPQFKLRLTPDLKDRIENSAAAAGRSMNAEILQRLEKSYDNETQDFVRLKVPEDIYGSVAIQSMAHEQSVADFILDAVKRQIGSAPEYQSASQRIATLIDEINTMEQDLKEVVAARDAWKHLYEQMQKTGTLYASLANGAIKEILGHKGQIPEDLEKFATTTRSALNASLTELFDEFTQREK